MRIHIESADGFDLLIEQVEPVGHGTAHGEQVHQSAADGVFARCQYLGDMGIACLGELLAQCIEVQLGALFEEKGVGSQEFAWRQAAQRGGGRHDDHIAGVVGNLVQRRKAFRDQILVRGEMIVRQRLPVGQEMDGQLRRKERDLVPQALGVPGGFRQNHQRSCFLRKPGQRQRIAGTVQAGMASALAG